MGLDRNNKGYHYNLGRLVAVIELMNDLDVMFINRVNENPKQGIELQLREACKKRSHNLYDELMTVYEVIYEKDFSSQCIPPVECGRMFIGYYHEKSFIDINYKILGNVVTTIERHEPVQVNMREESNVVNELKK